MRLQNPFAALSTTGIDSQVLVVLARSQQYLTIAQIRGLLPETGSLEGVRKSVNRLLEEGTVLARVIGRSAAYSLNREHLLIGPILQVADAKQELMRRLARQIAEWEVQPLTVKLFGSAARGDMTGASDIDLLVVMPDQVRHDDATALADDLASRASQWTGNDVHPLLYLEKEIQPASIFESILKEGIDVTGDPSWLRRQLRNRNADHASA